MRQNPFIILPFVAILLIYGLLTGCDRPSWQDRHGMVWNTIYNVTWDGPASLGDSILAALQPVERTLSVFDSNSLISQLNDHLAVKADRHLLTVYRECLRINEASGGMFDPTLGPAIDAWGFGKGHTPTSDTLRIDSLMQFVGLHLTSMRNDSIIKNDIRTKFNLSAIAKGYGCDLVAEMFRRNGVKNFLIEIGGEIVAAGDNPDGHPWKIGIDTPSEDGSDVAATIIQLKDSAIATSGNYRNFYDNPSGKYGHTLSPLTCRPVQTDVVSASVKAPSCMTADAVATTCMTLGSTKALLLCKKLQLPVILILNDGKIIYN